MGSAACRELPSRTPHVDRLGAAINMAARHSFNFAEALHLAIAGGGQGGLESDA